ncbi:MAG: hypothetical protein GF355_07570 [Candidatus Eisenbacteria bacterium]|nr:hypothetical protein [Candidatus Eisenbacteria bacterium]
MSVVTGGGIARLKIKVDPGELLETLGCRNHIDASARVQHRVLKAIDRVTELAEPEHVHRFYPVRVENGWARVNSSVKLRSRRLAHVLESCHTVHLFIVTLGASMDHMIAAAMRRRPHLGVILDAAASLAAESAADELQHSVAEALPDGQETTVRFSPGYCDWPLREQQKIFDLFPDRPVGVRLSGDYLMTPRKTVSAVFGVGPSARLTALRSPCAACGRAGCPHRRFS